MLVCKCIYLYQIISISQCQGWIQKLLCLKEEPNSRRLKELDTGVLLTLREQNTIITIEWLVKKLTVGHSAIQSNISSYQKMSIFDFMLKWVLPAGQCSPIYRVQYITRAEGVWWQFMPDHIGQTSVYHFFWSCQNRLARKNMNSI